jgi:signal peptidase II
MTAFSEHSPSSKADNETQHFQLWRWLGLGLLVLVLDRLTKYVVVSEMAYGDRIQILPFFAWVRWHNHGAAFSFLAEAGGWQRWFFIFLGIGFCIYILWEFSKLQKRRSVSLCLLPYSRRRAG